jgi:hypothetical protein
VSRDVSLGVGSFVRDPRPRPRASASRAREAACRQRFEQYRASDRNPGGIGSSHHPQRSGATRAGGPHSSRSLTREAARRQRFEQ